MNFGEEIALTWRIARLHPEATQRKLAAFVVGCVKERKHVFPEEMPFPCLCPDEQASLKTFLTMLNEAANA